VFKDVLFQLCLKTTFFFFDGIEAYVLDMKKYIRVTTPAMFTHTNRDGLMFPLCGRMAILVSTGQHSFLIGTRVERVSTDIIGVEKDQIVYNDISFYQFVDIVLKDDDSIYHCATNTLKCTSRRDKQLETCDYDRDVVVYTEKCKYYVKLREKDEVVYSDESDDTPRNHSEPVQELLVGTEDYKTQFEIILERIVSDNNDLRSFFESHKFIAYINDGKKGTVTVIHNRDEYCFNYYMDENKDIESDNLIIYTITCMFYDYSTNDDFYDKSRNGKIKAFLSTEIAIIDDAYQIMCDQAKIPYSKEEKDQEELRCSFISLYGKSVSQTFGTVLCPMSPQDLRKITKEYYVSPKKDGVHVMLMVYDKILYEVSIKREITKIRNFNYCNFLCDAEKIDDHYFVFDCSYCDKEVRTKMLAQRLIYVRQFVLALKSKKVTEQLFVRMDKVFGNVKFFDEVESPEGYVFTDPGIYQRGISNRSFKFKFNHTIDLLYKSIKSFVNEYERDGVLTMNYSYQLQKKDNSFINCTRPSIETKETYKNKNRSLGFLLAYERSGNVVVGEVNWDVEDDTICECEYIVATDNYRFIRKRPDRLRPNSLTTVESLKIVLRVRLTFEYMRAFFRDTVIK